MPRSPTPVAERFWPKVDKRSSDECWPWTAGLAGPYGSFYDGRANTKAHRIAYQLVKGEIPDGLQIDHLCRNRLCCNPNHLEAVTSRENTLRGFGSSAVNARKTHCINGHPFDEANTYVQRQNHRDCRACKIEAIRRSRAADRVVGLRDDEEHQ